jgi:hypothetical protein
MFFFNLVSRLDDRKQPTAGSFYNIFAQKCFHYSIIGFPAGISEIKIDIFPVPVGL